MKDSHMEELIGKLYEMVEDAPSILSRNYREKLLDLLDEIKEEIPAELQMAKEIVNKRDAILAATEKEAQKTRAAAEEYATQLVSTNEITIEARRRAAETIERAEQNAKELRRTAAIYCDERMRTAEAELSKIQGKANQTLAQLEEQVEAALAKLSKESDNALSQISAELTAAREQFNRVAAEIK